MAAISAIPRDPALMAVYQRLKANGEKTEVALVAVVRKLVKPLKALLGDLPPADPRAASSQGADMKPAAPPLCAPRACVRRISRSAADGRSRTPQARHPATPMQKKVTRSGA